MHHGANFIARELAVPVPHAQRRSFFRTAAQQPRESTVELDHRTVLVQHHHAIVEVLEEQRAARHLVRQQGLIATYPGDVAGNAENADQPAGLVGHRRLDGFQQHALTARGDGDPLLVGSRRTGGQCFAILDTKVVGQFAIDEIVVGTADDLRLRSAQQALECFIAGQIDAVGVLHPDHVRNGPDEPAKACVFLLQRRMRGAQLGHVARHQEIAAIVEALYQHLDRDHGAIATLQLQLPGVGLSVLKGRQTSLEARKIGIAEPCPDIFVQKRFERALKQPPERRIALLRAPAVTVEHADRCVHLRDQQAGLLRSHRQALGEALDEHPQQGSGHQHEEPALDGRQHRDPLWIAAHHAQRAVGEENPQAREGRVDETDPERRTLGLHGERSRSRMNAPPRTS